MSNHMVVNVETLMRPVSLPTFLAKVENMSSESPEPYSLTTAREDNAIDIYDGDDTTEEENSLVSSAECRICQDECAINNLESPCACNGSLKYVHRKCVQRWCNEKGNTICEICHQSKTATKSITLLIVASVAITLALLFVSNTNLVLSSRRSLLWRCSLRYSVIIDAGSSGTRIHVFGYWFKSGKPVFDFGKEHYANLKLSPGLSSYADNPDGASDSVTKLVEFAKGKIPKGKWKKSDIRLMATAGMRLLEPPVQEQILEVTRRVLRSSGFIFRDEWASVISGTDEGMYAWVIANHALGSLGSDPLQTTGIVELGGASAQVTFVSSEIVPNEFLRTITYGNVSYTIYSHSFLDYGQDAAEDTLFESLQNSAAGDGIVTDPCTPKGYIYDTNSQNKDSLQVKAAGDFSKCRSATFALLQEGKEKCPYDHCSIGSTFTPKLQGRFLATENFYHTSKFFGLEEKDWLSEMIPAGKSFCGEEWSTLKEKYPNTKEKYLHRYCFSSAYIISMLHDSLGVALNDQRIKYASTAGEENIPLDWALGAFILNTEKATSDYSGKSRKMLVF